MRDFHKIIVWVNKKGSLIGTGEDDTAIRRLAAIDTHVLLFGGIKGDVADGSLGLLFHTFLRFGGAIPMTKQKSTLLYLDFELLSRIHLAGIGEIYHSNKSPLIFSDGTDRQTVASDASTPIKPERS